MTDIDAMADSVMAGLKSYVASRLGPISKELADCKTALAAIPKVIDLTEVKTMIAEDIAAIPPPKNGKDAEPVDVDALRALLVAEIIKAVGDLPKAIDGEPGKDGDHGKDGLPGKDGTSLTVADLEPMLLDAVAKSVAALPAADRGASGERGESGLPGKDGTSLTVADLEPMLTAAVAKAVSEASALISKQLTDSIPAAFLIDDEGDLIAFYPAGNKAKVGHARGKDGRHGASIMDGAVDDGGQLILRMSDGRVINAGAVKGAPGEPGKSIKGEPGRDAIDQTILTSIDENTSYPARTCATYRNGTIRAVRDTDPIVDGDVIKAGWLVLMNGIADWDEQQLDDGRILEKRITYTSGKTVAIRHQTSSMIHRGVWKPGTYERGDNVTRGGSIWHCEKDTTDEPREGLDSGSWRLIVKRGRDGADAGRKVNNAPVVRISTDMRNA